MGNNKNRKSNRELVPALSTPYKKYPESLRACKTTLYVAFYTNKNHKLVCFGSLAKQYQSKMLKIYTDTFHKLFFGSLAKQSASKMLKSYIDIFHKLVL